MSFGCTLAEKSAMHEIHVHGELTPAWDTPTSFGLPGLAEDDDSFTTQHKRNAPKSFAARRCGTSFDVVQTDKMVSVDGPFKTQQEAEDTAAVLRMERRAEQVSGAAIREMAERAEAADEDEQESG